jgi:hypothetical protein
MVFAILVLDHDHQSSSEKWRCDMEPHEDSQSPILVRRCYKFDEFYTPLDGEWTHTSRGLPSGPVSTLGGFRKLVNLKIPGGKSSAMMSGRLLGFFNRPERMSSEV